jgi:TetR/AcrR family transcriptional regulator, tetracycline repressor protein
VTPRTATATAAKSDLSRDAIVERALSVMDTEGPDAVTIRRLAQEFGVTPMALYWHVANKEELLAAMGDALLAGVRPPPATGPWHAQLRGVVEVLIAELSRHPAAAELALPRMLMSEPGLRLAEFTLTLLTQLPGAESQAAMAERDALQARKRAHLESLPAEVYPHVRDAADVLTNCDDESAYYGFGVDLYIEGAQAILRRQRRTG